MYGNGDGSVRAMFLAIAQMQAQLQKEIISRLGAIESALTSLAAQSQSKQITGYGRQYDSIARWKSALLKVGKRIPNSPIMLLKCWARDCPEDSQGLPPSELMTGGKFFHAFSEKERRERRKSV